MRPTIPYRPLLAIAAVALLHAIFFIYYQQPDVETLWTDQNGYRRLGHVLAETGKFTRFPEMQPFVPETIRTPGYPALVAVAYRAFGENQIAVSSVQAVLFALTCILVFLIASRVTSEPIALGAAALTSVFPPIPYYGALVMTDVFAMFLITLAIWMLFRAFDTGRPGRFLAVGVVLGIAALTRPSFVLFPIALVLALLVALKFDWRRVLPLVWSLATFALVIAPWLLYNAVYVNRLAMSPAGGVGRGTWEASWQGVWAGRLQAELTKIADEPTSMSEADDQIRALAASQNLPAEKMMTYVHQWREIRKIWEIDAGPRERAVARIVADEEYWRVGLENIKQAGLSHVLRRITVGAFVLWAGEIPIRYSDINQTRPIYVRAMWLVQVGLVVLAACGLGVLWWRGYVLEAATMGALFLYITGVHLPLLAEARYSLPAKPMLLTLVAITLAALAARVMPNAAVISPQTAGS